ncbi:hypothetical protein BDV09DRAFT_203329 [Aspergillus tetrazonus]
MDWYYYIAASSNITDQLQELAFILPKDRFNIFKAFHGLGNLYLYQGKLEEAEEMYQQALAGKEKVLGPNHISTLDTTNSLGLLCFDQGKLKEAEEMYQQALAGKEKALGPGHTSTLGIVNNLGNLYKNQGKLKEAEEMYQRALAGYEKALGSDHSTTPFAMSKTALATSILPPLPPQLHTYWG